MSLTPIQFNLARQLEEDRRLQLEEECLRAALKKIRKQLHALRVERLYLESLKAKWEDLENQLNEEELDRLDEAVNSNEPPQQRAGLGQGQTAAMDVDEKFINQEQKVGGAHPGKGANKGCAKPK